MRSVFLGLGYSPPYQARFAEYLPPRLIADDWRAVLPVTEVPGGLLLDRIAAMIRGCERSVFDVSVPNHNVWFELGMAIALRREIALVCDVSPTSLHDILRGAWLRTYSGDAGCHAEVGTFLHLGAPPPMLIRQPPEGADPRNALVVGGSSRATAIAGRLRQAGWTVDTITPTSQRSLTDLIGAAARSAVTVAVRHPGSASWTTANAAAGMVALGAAYALGRGAIFVAGPGESIPSDCADLTVRGHSPATLADAVVSRVDLPIGVRPPLPGTTRPTLPGGIERSIAATSADALISLGAAALDAEPGYGKTVLCSQIADRVGGNVAWVSAAEDWSVADLVEAVVTTVGAHAPAFGWHALDAARSAERSDAQRSGGTDRKVLPSVFGEMLARDAGDAATSDHVVLIVDDAHHLRVDGGAVLAGLIQNRPAWLLIMVAGRGLPSPISDVVAASTWRAADLTFSLPETKDFIRQALPSAEDGQLEVMHDVTSGWPAALALARLWMQTRPTIPEAELRDKLRGDRLEVYQLLAHDHFTALPGSVQGELLLASLPSLVGPDEAEHLFGADGGQTVRRLALGPYFLIEQGPGDFRFHALFRQFLNQWWSDTRGASSLRRAKSDLALWYLGNDMRAPAFALAAEGGDWATAEAAITPIAGLIASRGDGALLMDLLERLPVERLRRSRPLREAWSRALSYVGDPRDLEEAIGLAQMPGATPGDQAAADLAVAEIRFQRGQLTEDAYVRECDGIADRLGEDNLRVLAFARLQSLGARTVRAGDPAAWPALFDEAQAIAELAEIAGAQSAAALALSQAADLLHRIGETLLLEGALQLQIRESLGAEVPLPFRVAAARQVHALISQGLELSRRADELAEEAGDDVARAVIALDFARTRSFAINQAVFIQKALDDGDREQAARAIGLALWAVQVFADRGMVRSVAIAYNVAGGAAASIDDQESRDQFTRHAEMLATESGFTDIAESARRIRERPTPLQIVAAPMPSLDQWTKGDLDRMVNELVAGTGAPPPVAEAMRSTLARVLRDDVEMDRLRHSTCRYLLLLTDESGPNIGGVPVVQPHRRATCRLLGTTMLEHQIDGKELAEKFIAAHCATCPERLPADAATDLDVDGGIHSIYRPMLERTGLSKMP